jgi:dephospho-CoA kinase
MFRLEKIGAHANIKVIGVTGSVSSGKSTLMGTLQKLGLHTLSVDEILDNLYKTNVELQQSLCDLLGDDILTNHMLDKKLIAQKIFHDPPSLKKCEKITLPYVLDRIKTLLKGVQGVVAIEVPLLFELSLEGLFDVTIFVKTEKSISKKRSPFKDFDLREKNTLSNEEKEQKAMFTITNNGTKTDFNNRIYKMMEGILA